MTTILGANVETVTRFVVNALAVGGGFLLGQWLTGFIVWFLDRKLTGGKSAPGLKRAARLLGGVALAVLVAIIVFGTGHGWSPFGGGGSGEPNGSPTTGTAPGTGGGGVLPTMPAADPRPTAATAPRESPPGQERVRVTLLGGEDVRDGRFYLVGDDRTPKNLAEAKAAVTARREAAGQPVGVEIRFTTRNTLPADHPAVRQLEAWARDHGLPVTFPAEGP